MIEPTSVAPLNSSAWLPVVSGFGGFIFGAVTEYLRDRRASTRERESRTAARNLQQLERRTTFQRQTLLDFQDAVQKLAQRVCLAITVVRFIAPRKQMEKLRAHAIIRDANARITVHQRHNHLHLLRHNNFQIVTNS
jgi:hypothetical protein